MSETMEGVCKFAEDNYGGPCKGPLLDLNDNTVGDTIYCEHHARVVTAWAQTHNKKPGPIWQFLNSLSPDGWKLFQEKLVGFFRDELKQDRQGIAVILNDFRKYRKKRAKTDKGTNRFMD